MNLTTFDYPAIAALVIPLRTGATTLGCLFGMTTTVVRQFVPRLGEATMGLSFRMRGSAKSRGAFDLEAGRDDQYLGRTQLGAPLGLELQAVQGDQYGRTATVWPDAPPALRVYGPAASIRSTLVPVDVSTSGAVGIFRDVFRTATTDTPGRYIAVFGYQVVERLKTAIGVFEVTAGGHRNGAVMATFHFAQPAGTTCITHQERGTIARGLRPYLDRGD